MTLRYWRFGRTQPLVWFASAGPARLRSAACQLMVGVAVLLMTLISALLLVQAYATAKPAAVYRYVPAATSTTRLASFSPTSASTAARSAAVAGTIAVADRRSLAAEEGGGLLSRLISDETGSIGGSEAGDGPNLIYESNPKHGPVARQGPNGEISRAPSGDCQAMLDCSTLVNPRLRTGVEPDGATSHLPKAPRVREHRVVAWLCPGRLAGDRHSRSRSRSTGCVSWLAETA